MANFAVRKGGDGAGQCGGQRVTSGYQPIQRNRQHAITSPRSPTRARQRHVRPRAIGTAWPDRATASAASDALTSGASTTVNRVNAATGGLCAAAAATASTCGRTSRAERVPNATASAYGQLPRACRVSHGAARQQHCVRHPVATARCAPVVSIWATSPTHSMSSSRVRLALTAQLVNAAGQPGQVVVGLFAAGSAQRWPAGRR